MAKLVINNDKKMSTIAPEIYGHFSEHLGRCIYEGLYVGEDSDIPNVNGMRTAQSHPTPQPYSVNHAGVCL